MKVASDMLQILLQKVSPVAMESEPRRGSEWIILGFLEPVTAVSHSRPRHGFDSLAGGPKAYPTLALPGLL